MVTPFCAVCTSDLAPFSREPLGKNDAMVLVCVACSTHAIRVVDGPHRGYEPTGGLLRVEDARDGMVRAIGRETAERAGRIEDEMQRSPSVSDWKDRDMIEYNKESKRRINMATKNRRPGYRR